MTKSTGLNVLFMSYRDWAMPVLRSIERHPKVGSITHAWSTSVAEERLSRPHRKGRGPQFDVVIYCGWSDEPLEYWVKQVLHVGVHCAESDVYSGGSPIQNQIIDGVNKTKHRIFKVWHPELSLREYSHEVELDLSGNMEHILCQMTATSMTLFNMFFDDWPNVIWKTWPEISQDQIKPRRTPEQSIIKKEDLVKMSTKDLYNFFRCLESPYPNGRIEDEHGQLIIERVNFKEK